MNSKITQFLLLAAAAMLSACSNNHNSGSPRDTRYYPYGISCDTGFAMVTANSMAEIMVDTTDKISREITLKSASKYGYDQSAYNLSANCFSRKGHCDESVQLKFNYGGDAKGLDLEGHFIVLTEDAKAKYSDINFNNLDALKLVTVDGTSVSKDTIFGNPSTGRKLALGRPDIYRDYEAGTVLLALVDDTWSNDYYQLFKIRIKSVVPGEEVSFSYERIAEAPKSDLKNFYCSKQSQLKKTVKNEGEAIVFSGSYSGWESSTFGFDYGINGFDGRFVHSNEVMSFSEGNKCSNSIYERCVTSYVGGFANYWGGVIDLGDKPLSEVNKSSWPNLQTIDPKSAAANMKENRTYLISELNSSQYTFGAIRINEIDPQGRWVKFHWKRVAIEKPYRFVQYTKADIPSAEAIGEVTLTKEWWKGTHLDVALAKQGPPTTEAVYFNVSRNSFKIDNRYFPSHSGIVDVTGMYSNINSIPENTPDQFVNNFSQEAQIKVGGTYIVVTEKFWYRAALAVQVVNFVPGESVQLKYKRLYNLQTFPGRWYK
ncbi:MAG: hypothetical protein ACXVCN_19770 [Bdellovibrio sp.]